MLSAKFLSFFFLFVFYQVLFSFEVALAAPTLKVGFLHPLTGKYSETGQAHKVGAEYIIEQINSTGGIKALGGAKIQLVLADTTSQIAPITGEMERLCTLEKRLGRARAICHG